MTDFRNTHTIEHNPDSIIAVGCSCTYGTGVDTHETWPAQLELSTGLPVYNFGVPGGSLDTCYRVLDTFLPAIQSRYVFVQKPSINRRELIHFGEYMQIGHWSKQFTELLDPLEIELNERRQLHAIDNITNRYNSKLVIIDFDSDGYTKGTDNSHPGPDWHKALSNKFKESI